MDVDGCTMQVHFCNTTPRGNSCVHNSKEGLISEILVNIQKDFFWQAHLHKFMFIIFTRYGSTAGFLLASSLAQVHVHYLYKIWVNRRISFGKLTCTSPCSLSLQDMGQQKDFFWQAHLHKSMFTIFTRYGSRQYAHLTLVYQIHC
jgi:hypothetical protein